MSWSNVQKAAAKMAQKALCWQRPQYELMMRNAGVRQECGKISSTNFSANDRVFERFMAYCERSGYVDPKHGPGHWIAEASKQCSRMHWMIAQWEHAGRSCGILYDADVIHGFIERQTEHRPGGPTRDLTALDWEWSYKVLEGLKAWLWREAKNRGIRLDLDRNFATPGDPK